MQGVPRHLHKEWFIGPMVLLQKGDRSIGHPKYVGRVGVAIFMRVFVPDVPVSFVVAIRCRAASVDMPLAVMSSRVPRFSQQLGNGDFAGIQLPDITRFNHPVT